MEFHKEFRHPNWEITKDTVASYNIMLIGRGLDKCTSYALTKAHKHHTRKDTGDPSQDINEKLLSIYHCWKLEPVEEYHCNDKTM